MRSLFLLVVSVCVLGAASIGCGSSGDSNGAGGTAGSGGSGGSGGTGGTGGSGGSGGTGGTGGTGGSGGTAGTGGSGGTGGTGGTAGSGGVAPVIEMVEWAWKRPCDPNASGEELVVTITATDEDTDVSQLTYSGAVQDCAGNINAAETTLTCEPYLGLRQSDAIVTDPQGNQDSLFFGVDPCTDGSACEDGLPCP